MSNSEQKESTWRNVAFDLESNGLFDVPVEERLIWCIGCMDVETGEYRHFKGDALPDCYDLLLNADIIIGHNIVGYDIPWIESVAGIRVDAHGKVWDTKIVSTLYKPDMPGHRLADWGKRLGYPKIDYRQELIDIGALDLDKYPNKGDEFKFYHPLMDEYMQRDVEVSAKLFRAEIKMGQKDGWGDTLSQQMGSLAFRMEHEAQRVMYKQETTGWLFNSHKAEHLLHRIDQCFAAIDRKLDTLIPCVIKPKGVTINEPFLKSGKGVKKSVADHMPDTYSQVAGPFTRITIERISYNSDKQIKDALIRLGWRATDFTDAGNPRLTDDSLKVWGGRVGEMISKRMMYKHRRGLVAGLLKNVRPDGRVGAGGTAQGAVTGRVTHRVVANIPRYTSPVGAQIRSLFTSPADKVLVGCDAAGLELRCLAHYVNNEDITKEILEGDIHQKNADACGVDRNTVKTLTYGWLYGAGDAKLGATALDSTIGKWGGTKEEGAIVRAKFLKSMNAETLMAQVAKAAERGFLKGIDGRIIPIRSEHAALNTLLQSAGAIVMKLAYIKLDSWLEADPSRGKLLCFYHDEYTVECDPQQAEQTGAVMAKCIAWAGKKLGFRVPLEGDPQIGNTWKEIH